MTKYKHALKIEITFLLLTKAVVQSKASRIICLEAIVTCQIVLQVNCLVLW